MKRNIKAFWLEVKQNGDVLATVMREKTGYNKPHVYNYSPTRASINRINKTAKQLAQDGFSPYESNPVDNFDVLVGWVLWRVDRAVYPPPMGTQFAGQKLPFVPSEASIL